MVCSMLHRSFVSSLVVALLSLLAFFAPPAFADSPTAIPNSPGPITGWQLPPVVCANSSISPVVVSNYTSVPQTGSITINSELSSQVGVYASAQAASDSPFGICFGGISTTALTTNFVVDPGQTNVYYLGMGGTNKNLVSTSHNIAIGGLPNGTANPKWYDFVLSLTSDEDFSSLKLSYNNTGGIGSSNGQNGFNVVAIENGVATQNILSPYSSTNAGGNVVWSANQPIGLAWLPLE
jgi:hypothetical protein